MQIYVHAVIPMTLIILFYLVGGIIQNVIKIADQFHPVVIGFVFFMALFEIVALPFFLMGWSFSLLCVFIVAAIFCGLIFGKIKRNTFEINHIREALERADGFGAVAAGLMVFDVIVATTKQCGDWDDSFYLAWMSSILESDHFYLFDPASGNGDFVFQDAYRLVGYEPFGAFLCRIFQVNPAQLAHSALPVVYIVIFFLLLHSLCQIVFETNKSQGFLFAVIWCVFGSYAHVEFAYNLNERIWQGKIVLYCIIFPAFFLEAMQWFRNQRFSKRDIVVCTGLLYAGFCLTTVGVYLVPLMYLIYAVCFFLYEKKLKNIKYILFPLIFAMPFALMKFYIIEAGNMKQVVTAGAENIDWQGNMWVHVFRDKKELFIMLACLFLIILCGSRILRYLFGVSTVICLLTVLNPLFSSFVASHITGTDVYWRLFFLLNSSLWPIVAYACLMQQKRKRIIKRLLPIIAIFMIWGGSFARNIRLAQNLEKLNPMTIMLSDRIIDETHDSQKNPEVFLPEPYYYEVRQYTGRINLVWNRYAELGYRLNNNPDGYAKLSALFERIYVKHDMDDGIIRELRDYGTEFVGIEPKYNKKFQQFPVVFSGEEIEIYDIR